MKTDLLCLLKVYSLTLQSASSFSKIESQVGDKEIVAQEERVQEARDRLASAIKALS